MPIFINVPLISRLDYTAESSSKLLLAHYCLIIELWLKPDFCPESVIPTGIGTHSYLHTLIYPIVL